MGKHPVGIDVDTACLIPVSVCHTDEVMATMNKARVPSGPILSTSDIYQEPQYKARNMFHKAAPPSGGQEFVLPALLPVLSATPGATRWVLVLP